MPVHDLLTSSVVVATTTETLLPQIRQFSQQLRLPKADCLYDDTTAIGLAQQYHLLLLLAPDGLMLKDLQAKHETPIKVDFNSAKLYQRSHESGAAKQMLAKAVGIKPGYRPSIVDATAGLGRDSFVLASLGCHVTMIERHPIVAELLLDGLQRAARHPESQEVINRIKFHPMQAVEHLAAIAENDRPDVVYLDPMFPHRNRSAQIKKEMRLFQSMVGVDEDVTVLLGAALRCARKRVVVKRPSKGEGVAGKEAHLVLTGKSTRYDVYFNHS